MIMVYVDGLCEPRNPGGVASYGFAVYSGDEKLHEQSGVVGEGSGMSNNVAEYAALFEALEWLLGQELKDEEVIVRSDSRLLVNQMSGHWLSHGGLYADKYSEALKLASHFTRISFVWVPREQNVEADSLSRKAYEEYSVSKGAEPRYYESEKS